MIPKRVKVSIICIRKKVTVLITTASFNDPQRGCNPQHHWY